MLIFLLFFFLVFRIIMKYYLKYLLRQILKEFFHLFRKLCNRVKWNHHISNMSHYKVRKYLDLKMISHKNLYLDNLKALCINLVVMIKILRYM